MTDVVDTGSAAIRLVLDADGVFLSERPYWCTALATVLERSDLVELARPNFTELAIAAFDGGVGLERVAKERGLNSNWDLAAVLDRALEDRSLRVAVEARLQAQELDDAAEELARAARALQVETTSRDPLASFGVDRQDDSYGCVVATFQRVLGDEATWPFPRQALREPESKTRAVFDALRKAGYRLGICTGRPRDEIERPLATFGLRDCFVEGGMTNADDVAEAERRTGESALGKPHPFSLILAVAGADAARAALRGLPVASQATGLFVGDSWSDYLTACAAREVGLRVRYLHVRSGVTTAAQEATIDANPIALGVADDLQAAAQVLGVRT